MITLISLFGLYIRLIGLGNFPLAIDEYYFYSAVKLILDKGLPEFLCGGYYTRGILLQYLSVPFVYLIQNQELAIRLPIVIFSALTFPAVYLIGKESHSRLAGVLALFLFAFSIWQIEFARFARMYTPFQMIFLWQIFLFLRPNLPSRNINILLNALLATIGTLIYAGGIFCVALAFFNIVLYQNNFRIREYILAFIPLSISALLNIYPFRQLGAEYPYPPHEQSLNQLTTLEHASAPTSSFPIDLPNVSVLTNNSNWLTATAFIYTIIILTFLFTIFKNNNITLLTKLLTLGITAAFFFNQIFLAGTLIIICALTLENKKPLVDTVTKKTGIIYITSTALRGILSMLFLVFDQYSNSPVHIIKTVFDNFFSYPDVYFDVFKQWQKPIPMHSIISIISILFISFLCIFGSLKSKISTRFLMAAFLLVVLLVAIIQVPYNTSRYTYFLSSLVQIFLAISIISISSLFKNRIFMISTIIFTTSAVCYASEDYRLKHLLSIDSYKSNYRLTYNKHYTRHIYPRYDYKAVAKYLVKNARQDDNIIVTTPVIASYLDSRLHTEYFIAPDNLEFSNHSACHGKREQWSNLPLIYSYEELDKKLKDPESSSWVILHGERGNPFTSKELEKLKNDLGPYFVYDNPDKTLRVYRINKK